jgi:hypothetical protein
MDTIGLIAEPTHPVFGRVADRLAARGFGVEFLPPREPTSREEISALDAVANTVVSGRSVAILRHADAAAVETWNGFVPTTALAARRIAMHAMESLGCTVPPRDGQDAAQKAGGTASSFGEQGPTQFQWTDPAGLLRDATTERAGERTRYYAVDDGVETHVQARTLHYSLDTEAKSLSEATVDVEFATRIRELLNRFDARAVAVDFATRDGTDYAVTVNPVPQFYDIGMERRIADSMASLTTIGA